jgi:hypothetical protein
MKSKDGVRLDSIPAGFNPSDVGDDLIVILGQSNAVGGGADTIDTTYVDTTNPRIRQFAGSGSYFQKIITAVDGLFHLYQASTVGPGMPFAREYVRRIPSSRSVLLVPAAQGSTGFVPVGGVTWDPADNTTTTNLYRNAIAQIDAALAASGANSRLAAVIWVQGESDAGALNQTQYAAKLDSVITGLRTYYNKPTLPFVIGQMVPSYISANSGSYGPINAAHIDTPRRLAYTAFSYGASGSGTVNSGGPAQLVHYSAAGNRINGASMYDVYARFALSNIPNTAPVVPGTVSLSQTGSTVNVTWLRNPGRVTDYKVEYNPGSGWTTLVRSQSIDLNATITGLTSGTSVQVRVSAINEQGTSAPTIPVTLALVVAPGQVTGLSAGSFSSYSVPLSWSATSGATSYLMQYQVNGAGTWYSGGSTSALSATLMGLNANTNYTIRVTASNAGGTGTPSATVSGSTTNPPLLSAAVGSSPSSAYGLRQLVSGYSGPLIRVRRSSDNTEQDIPIAAIGGGLDTAALLTFVGSNNAYVTKWYDQGTAIHDLAQATQTNQPRLVNAGVIDTDGSGRPSVYFNGANWVAHASPTAYAAAAVSTLSVHTLAVNSAAHQGIYTESGTATGARWLPNIQLSSGLMSYLVRNDTTQTISVGYTPQFGLHQRSSVEGSGTATIYENGVSKVSGAITKPAPGTFSNAQLGAWNSANALTGYISEFVMFYSALTNTARQAGESNQKAYFGTP